MSQLFTNAQPWTYATLPAYLIAFVVGYGLGSIPFGLLLTRFAGTADLRTIGSGNIGATNVLRTGRKDLAAITLLLDALKGTAAVLIVGALAGPQAALFAGFAAFIGHLFPVWLRFNGGKGVATYLGVALGLWWVAGLAFIAVWLIVAKLSKYSSLSALVASAMVPIVFFGSGRWEAGILAFICALLLWWRHAPNIARLRAGTEGRIGQVAQ
ncbi:MAG: glycerol-3-phosphate 1-O-acyltransferase PlsY [Beijerinckiaceae bacterium]|nr:glycerol-3-phosphate 1-O-acyltransferase PlsY [Beijerinckiaceae bacterium]